MAALEDALSSANGPVVVQKKNASGEVARPPSPKSEATSSSGTSRAVPEKVNGPPQQWTWTKPILDH
eukprot:2783373-Prorocentrum_lima.AAC.1